jgi:hypothetical protein
MIFDPIRDRPRLEGQSVWFRNSTPTLELSEEYWSKVRSGFEARRGEINEWTVPLPDELIRAVREALK